MTKNDEKYLIEYINLKRHEYLNDLQVLLGYAQLGKMDKIFEYIQKVIDKCNDERTVFNSDMDSIMKYIKNKIEDK
ncbi:Spo0B domain-containing protein [Thermoanaerobacterium thermosaccharolyticum]|jgi:sensor histidine kinase regulating citrate/malate metabolism|uniref:Signal transduction histidine kinase regulating citrate/malate metabolism n=2 Tax=Thermoanaerobacterium thermosaccharolyticum TaxID=1517 RepID=D9TP42_THETC|nr:Spo0B domain-containing protein [Thermoanaerobacterium thermosaccharolyticum]ADL68661.1 signal transduction histidine kinase regulating citrate/malate metabolism [Thermoanaerobacterium thermosaccharolyticum DSM 571]AST56367.1 signal transduction histidine kinase regulating citrate malate metabolism [Thermoanaerobacterium thermosaccharolyticum]KAA5806746.1 histidine kinase [Thermoanaerobacterium thermosaccharolyticum]MBE0069574.1 histidine kinase [Thermoanaerobacterium thermosaccharolyticum]